MREETFIIECPCCGERLEIERRTGRIVKRWPKPDTAADGDIMQAALKKMEDDKARLDSYFATAGTEMETRERKLSELFEKEKKKIEESGDFSKPETPFDLD
ncbi:MAG: hypothetical protein J6Z08_01245 [Elusimicrobiales bacterium]|jgi:predicted nuclease with TOPRIM domain|nr:hypothetical protein [Elusimicrobiales bacterium]